ncbi:hypothetical protein ZIOFF_064595 [Zingiber officinale]|uniref:RRM domain-containing protein n=1 Tax=Zingiber officinale TaxID=94328 RepID=A0A8J5EYL4_ZINOF|nr:hypothetical protein ZIOFF_064595 [Zingiber officinale]
MDIVDRSNGVDLAMAGRSPDFRRPKDLAASSSAGFSTLRPIYDHPSPGSFLAKSLPLAQPHAKDGLSDSAPAGSESEGFKQDMRDLAELLSKLNPMAEEFVPPSLGRMASGSVATGGGFFGNRFVVSDGMANGVSAGNSGRRKKNGYDQEKRRMNSRTSLAQREEVIRRTVYVSEIDHQVTEEQLAILFIHCGQVVDCRMCGDPNSVLRFAFIEFTDEEGARAALDLSGTVLGYYPVRVLPSKTAIAPVNPTFLPRSNDEREMCSRTVYCTNIDKKISQADLKLFFESVCGEVYRLRLLGDYHHSTRIAFVEFVMAKIGGGFDKFFKCITTSLEVAYCFKFAHAESATSALNCSGVVLGSLPIRVSPSKTPVRPRTPRASMRLNLGVP